MIFISVQVSSVSDPLDANPDLAVHFDAYPYPIVH